MKPVIYSTYILLMLVGNIFGLYKLWTGKQELFAKFPFLTEAGYNLFKWLPVVTIFALVAMWFLKRWGVYLAIVCGIAVIMADTYFGIHYHLYVAIPSLLILILLFFKYRQLLVR